MNDERRPEAALSGLLGGGTDYSVTECAWPDDCLQCVHCGRCDSAVAVCRDCGLCTDHIEERTATAEELAEMRDDYRLCEHVAYNTELGTWTSARFDAAWNQYLAELAVQAMLELREACVPVGDPRNALRKVWLQQLTSTGVVGVGQDAALSRVAWNLALLGAGEAEAYEVWREIADRTPLLDPSWPWTHRDFRRHYRGALRKLAAQAYAENTAWRRLGVDPASGALAPRGRSAA